MRFNNLLVIVGTRYDVCAPRWCGMIWRWCAWCVSECMYCMGLRWCYVSMCVWGGPFVCGDGGNRLANENTSTFLRIETTKAFASRGSSEDGRAVTWRATGGGRARHPASETQRKMLRYVKHLLLCCFCRSMWFVFVCIYHVSLYVHNVQSA